MTVRSLNTRLRRLTNSSMPRCACGAYLPPEAALAKPVEFREGYRLPEHLEELRRGATPSENQELETIMNRCIELRPELATLQETSYRIWGGEPSEARLLRFRFAEVRTATPCCLGCGRAVVRDPVVTWIDLSAPPPSDLLDALKREPPLAGRYEELIARLQCRVDRECPAEDLLA